MKRLMMAAALAVSLAACGGGEKVAEVTENAREATSNAAAEVRAQFAGDRADSRMSREEIERQRMNSEWRRLQSFQQRRPRPQDTPPPPVEVQFRAVSTFDETLENVAWQNLDELPVTVPISGDVEGPSVLRAQVLLDQVKFFPGVIDGQWGKNTEIAVYWFQEQNGIEPTGTVDEATWKALAGRAGSGATLRNYTITAQDAAGPFVTLPEDVYEKAKLDCLCYENIAELLAEKFHTTVETLAMLNGGRDPNTFRAGETILGLAVGDPAQTKDIGEIVVSVSGNYLQALSSDGRILLHAPTTVGNEYDPSPTEELKIVGIAFNPTFHYQPKLFYEVPDEEPEAMLQEGPNSPVGVVWMALSKDNYGIHGTSDPDSIGYASSHGCIRLTNWNAQEVATRSAQGIKVDFTDER